MNTITVRHRCGHEGKHAASGTEAERAQRAAWLAGQPCRDCWRAEQTAAAAAQRDEWHLPALAGSADEAAWAEVIRAKAFAHNKWYHDALLAERPFEEDPAAQDAVVAAASVALQSLQAEARAAWWIENRFEAPNYVKQQVVEALRPILNPANSASA